MKISKTIELLTNNPQYRTIMKKVRNQVKNNCIIIVNRQCEYHEFKEIMKQGFLAEADHPYFKWKNKLND